MVDIKDIRVGTKIRFADCSFHGQEAEIVAVPRLPGGYFEVAFFDEEERQEHTNYPVYLHEITEIVGEVLKASVGVQLPAEVQHITVGPDYLVVDTEMEAIFRPLKSVAARAPEAKADEHAARKGQPMARGLLDYFPDALAGIAHVSLVANEQHNPGEPMHWAYGKSMDHADCIVRHLADRGTVDADGLSHTAKVAWRALALLQTELEKADPELHARRQAQRDAAAKGER